MYSIFLFFIIPLYCGGVHIPFLLFAINGVGTKCAVARRKLGNNRKSNWMVKLIGSPIVIIAIIIVLMVSFSFFFLTESEEFGPVFIQEPDDVIFPLDSDEKKVVMHCEARGNPPPTYRCDIMCLSSNCSPTFTAH